MKGFGKIWIDDDEYVKIHLHFQYKSSKMSTSFILVWFKWLTCRVEGWKSCGVKCIGCKWR